MPSVGQRAAADAPAAWTPPTPLPERIEGEGVVIRAYVHEDAPALFAAFSGGRESFLPWLAWARREHTRVEETTAFIERAIRARRNLLHPETNETTGATFGVFESGKLVGGIGFLRVRAERLTGEVGYWVAREERGRGVCTRATRVFLRWCFTPQTLGGFGFRRMDIYAAKLNAASCAVPRKLGLRQVLEARAERWLEGVGWVDFCGWEAFAGEV